MGLYSRHCCERGSQGESCLQNCGPVPGCEAEQTSPLSKQSMSIIENLNFFFSLISYPFSSCAEELRAAMLAADIMATRWTSHSIKQCVLWNLGSNGGGRCIAWLGLEI